MYFWNIQKAERALANADIGDREVLPYFICWCALSACALFVSGAENIWSQISSSSSILLAVVGPYYAYRSNAHNAAGSFLANYFVVGWVWGIRVSAVYLVVLVLLMASPLYDLLLESLYKVVAPLPLEEANPIDVILGFLVELTVYVNICRSLRRLPAQRSVG